MSGISLFTLGWIGGTGGDITLIEVSGIEINIDPEEYVMMIDDEEISIIVEDE